MTFLLICSGHCMNLVSRFQNYPKINPSKITEFQQKMFIVSAPVWRRRWGCGDRKEWEIWKRGRRRPRFERGAHLQLERDHHGREELFQSKTPAQDDRRDRDRSLVQIWRKFVSDLGLFRLQWFYCDQQLMQCVAINWKVFYFSTMHCISHWSQQNRYSLNKPLRLIHTSCSRSVWYRKIEKNPISAEMQPSVAAAHVKHSLCESAFMRPIFCKNFDFYQLLLLMNGTL